MKKGFTVVELLATIVIIAIIGGIGIISYNYVFDSSSENYYKTLEQELLLTGNDYFVRNREELPINGYNKVTISDLVNGNYISPILDKKGNVCEEGDVYVTRDSETNNYNYTVCLTCDTYKSDGIYCDGYVPGYINVTAKLSETDIGYNPLLSYKNVGIIDDKDVEAEIKYVKKNEKDKDVAYFRIDKIDNKCEAINNQCNVTIDKSGSYKISAYDENNQKVADDRVINVKIDREAPTFDIKTVKRYIIETGSTTNLDIKIENIKDDFGIAKIEYCITEAEICNGYKKLENEKNIITDAKESGSYKVKVRVTDLSGKEEEKEEEFEIAYKVKLKYDNSKIEDYYVIKGKKYGYLDSLPKIYNKKPIRWKMESNGNVVTDETMVELGSSHTLIAEYQDKVEILTSSVCNDLTYNGRNQKLINDREGMVFSDNVGLNAGPYTVRVKLLYGMVWSDNTDEEKTVTCNIKKAPLTCPDSPADKEHTGNSQNSGITCPSGSTASGDTTGTNVGTYNQSCVPDNNHEFSSACSVEWKIVSSETLISCTITSPAAKTYSGIAQASGITCPTGSTASGDTTGTDAGTYTQTCVANTGYKFNGTCSATWTINKAANTVTITNQTYTYDGTGKATSSSATSGTPAVTYYSDSSCSTITTTSNATSAGGTPIIVGTYYATAAVAANGNYAAGSALCTQAVVINKRTVSVTAPTVKAEALYGKGNLLRKKKFGSCTAGGTMYVYNSNPTTSSSAPSFSTSTWTKVSDLTIDNYHGSKADTYYIWYYCEVTDTANNKGNKINTVKKVSKEILPSKTSCTQTDIEGICGGYDECKDPDDGKYYINKSYKDNDENYVLTRGLCFTNGDYCYVKYHFVTSWDPGWKADSDLSLNFNNGLNTGHCTTNNCYLFQPKRTDLSAWATDPDSGAYRYMIYNPKNKSPKCP